MASGGPGSAKNDPKSANVIRKLQKCKKLSKLAKENRIAAKPSSQRWSTFWKENHQKLAFREGVQPWDLASFSGRIESYRFIMESSKSKPYSASYDFPSWQWLSAPSGMLASRASIHSLGSHYAYLLTLPYLPYLLTLPYLPYLTYLTYFTGVK